MDVCGLPILTMLKKTRLVFSRGWNAIASRSPVQNPIYLVKEFA